MARSISKQRTEADIKEESLISIDQVEHTDLPPNVLKKSDFYMDCNMSAINLERMKSFVTKEDADIIEKILKKYNLTKVFSEELKENRDEIYSALESAYIFFKERYLTNLVPSLIKDVNQLPEKARKMNPVGLINHEPVNRDNSFSVRY